MPIRCIVHQSKHLPRTTGIFVQDPHSNGHDFAPLLHNDAEIESVEESVLRKHGGLGRLTGVVMQWGKAVEKRARKRHQGLQVSLHFARRLTKITTCTHKQKIV